MARASNESAFLCFFRQSARSTKRMRAWGYRPIRNKEKLLQSGHEGMINRQAVMQSAFALRKKAVHFFLCNTSPFRLPQFFFWIIVYLSFTQQDSVMLLRTWHSIKAKIERYLWFLSQPFQSFGTICIFASRAGFSRTHYLHSICM